MCPKFRYGDEKVLGTQPNPTRGLAFTHCILRLNLIKSIFNIVILDSLSLSHTHTHTRIHLSKQHGISFPNPSIHLSRISYQKPSIHLSCFSIQNTSKAASIYHPQGKNIDMASNELVSGI